MRYRQAGPLKIRTKLPSKRLRRSTHGLRNHRHPHQGRALRRSLPDRLHPSQERRAAFEAATQLYIDPVGCIDCGACIPACTSDVIFIADDRPRTRKSFWLRMRLLRVPPAATVGPCPSSVWAGSSRFHYTYCSSPELTSFEPIRMAVVPRTTNQVSNRHSPTRMLAYLPLIFACGQFFDDLTQFLWPICPKARHHSIEQQDQGNDRNQIRPEQP